MVGSLYAIQFCLLSGFPMNWSRCGRSIWLSRLMNWIVTSIGKEDVCLDSTGNFTLPSPPREKGEDEKSFTLFLSGCCKIHLPSCGFKYCQYMLKEDTVDFIVKHFEIRLGTCTGRTLSRRVERHRRRRCPSTRPVHALCAIWVQSKSTLLSVWPGENNAQSTNNQKKG